MSLETVGEGLVLLKVIALRRPRSAGLLLSNFAFRLKEEYDEGWRERLTDLELRGVLLAAALAVESGSGTIGCEDMLCDRRRTAANGLGTSDGHGGTSWLSTKMSKGLLRWADDTLFPRRAR